MAAGDFMDENGNKLGTDGKKDDNVFIVTDYYSKQKIRENDKKGQTTQAEDVNVRVSTTYDILKEAVDNYCKGIMNGGKTEEASAMDNDGNWHRTTGNESSVNIPISTGKVTIHFHPLTEGTDGSYSSPKDPSGIIVNGKYGDVDVFKGFSQNIITGKDAGRYDSVLGRTNRIPTMSFYSNNGSKKPFFSMSIESAIKIIIPKK
jgi:hypothetical protein